MGLRSDRSEEEPEAQLSPLAPSLWPWLNFPEGSESGGDLHSGPPRFGGPDPTQLQQTPRPSLTLARAPRAPQASQVLVLTLDGSLAGSNSSSSSY